MDQFLKHINSYYPLTEAARYDLLHICKKEQYKKNELILTAGDWALHYYFIERGLLGYYALDNQGDTIYKMFFEENSFAASTAAIIEHQPSTFNIIALEDTTVICYNANKFRELLVKHHDLALFHIHYLEKNWVVKKEPLEIDLKWQSAKERYLKMLQNPLLLNRLKLHHIASYLGVTPTQLSRIRKEINS